MKILYTYPIYYPTQKLIGQYFINDQKIMESKHEVRVCEFIYLLGILKGGHLIFFIKNVVQLFRGVLWCDVTVSWFGKLHAFFAVLFCKLLGKKSIVIAGGEEAANMTIDGKPYGLYSHPLKKWFVKFMLYFADEVVAVSEYNEKEIIENTGTSPKKIKLIYHGFDSDYYRKLPDVEKKNIVVTVGHINRENYLRKGLKIFVESAAFLPKVQFFLVGAPQEEDNTCEELKLHATSNVIFTGYLSFEGLTKLLSEASVYVQLSKHEAFGCSVAEAMLHECVPVVSRNTTLPEVVGDCGFFVNDFISKDLADKIQEALVCQDLGKKARKRIKEHFSLEKRKDGILKLLETMENTK